jgi:hypothetical protein
VSFMIARRCLAATSPRASPGSSEARLLCSRCPPEAARRAGGHNDRPTIRALHPTTSLLDRGIISHYDIR